MPIESIITNLSAGLIPVIACVTTYIAIQQYKSNRLKLKMDRYDRRLSIYKSVIRIITIVQQKGSVDFEDIAQFRSSVAEAEFLFNADVSRFLANIDKTCFELWGTLLAIDALRKDPSSKQQFDNKIESKRQNIEWLVNQFKPAKIIFKPYLDISK